MNTSTPNREDTSLPQSDHTRISSVNISTPNPEDAALPQSDHTRISSVNISTPNPEDAALPQSDYTIMSSVNKLTLDLENGHPHSQNTCTKERITIEKSNPPLNPSLLHHYVLKSDLFSKTSELLPQLQNAVSLADSICIDDSEVHMHDFDCSTPQKSGVYFPSFFPAGNVLISPVKANANSDTNEKHKEVGRKRKMFAKDVIRKRRSLLPKIHLNRSDPIDVEKIHDNECQGTRAWLPSQTLYMNEKDILQSNRWLNDRIVNAAQNLLKEANPAVPGLQDVTCGLIMSFTVEAGEFVQILHNGKDHWVMISTIGLNHPEVAVYDSLYPSVPTTIKMQIATLLLTQQPAILLHNMDVQMQSGTSDCGVFAIAFATALVLGSNPSELFFDQLKMRQHLLQCLEKRCITMFPIMRLRRTLITVVGALKRPEGV